MNYKSLVSTVILSSLLLSACSQDDTTTKNVEKKVEQTTHKVEKEAEKVINGPEKKPNESIKEALKLGQSKKIKSITFKLKSAKEVGNHISVNVSKKQKVVTLTYDVTNGSKENYVAGQDAIIYLKGEKADEYALGTDKNATIRPGQSAEVSQSFIIPSKTHRLEIELGQALKENGKRALYIVNLK